MSDQTEGMTDEELAAELERLETIREQRRREAEREQRRAEIIAQVDALLLELQQLDGVQAGTEWQRPTSAAGAYPLGAVMSWGGETWENLVPSNPYEPGVSGWGLVAETDPGTGVKVPPRFVQPAGAHDAYQEGQRITWEDGLVYATTRAGVVHTPTEAPGDWLLVEPDPAPEAPDPEQPDPETDRPDPEEVEEDPEADEPAPGTDQPALAEWEPGKTYTAGDQLTYQGTTYTVVQGHTSQAHWTPDQVGSLYQRVDS